METTKRRTRTGSKETARGAAASGERDGNVGDEKDFVREATSQRGYSTDGNSIQLIETTTVS